MGRDGPHFRQTASNDEVEPVNRLGSDVDGEAVGGDAVSEVDAYACHLHVSAGIPYNAWSAIEHCV